MVLGFETLKVFCLQVEIMRADCIKACTLRLLKAWRSGESLGPRAAAQSGGQRPVRHSAAIPFETWLIRKGTDGVSTNGVTAKFRFFDGRTFWVTLLNYFYLPKSARAYLFPQSVKINNFCSGPISVDPICPQPTDVWATVSVVECTFWVLLLTWKAFS